MRKKILILSEIFGSGHTKAAEALLMKDVSSVYSVRDGIGEVCGVVSGVLQPEIPVINDYDVFTLVKSKVLGIRLSVSP